MTNKQTRILYVEDNLGLATLVQRRLGRRGYAVDLAKNGEEGLSSLEKGEYDMVIMDYMMPVMDGLEMLKKLAAEGELPLPAIMVTGGGDETIAVDAMKLGASDYLTKDIEGNYFKLLPSVIERVLEKQRLILEKNRAEQSLRYRDAILEAVSYAAEQFLKTNGWRSCIQEVLARLGHAADVSRTYLFENHMESGKFLAICRRYEWLADDIFSPRDKKPFNCIAVPRWFDLLRQRLPVYGQTKEFPPDEADMLMAHGIRSLVAIPVFVGQSWWGGIGLDDCRTERVWPPAVIDAFKAASGTLGAVIQRERMEEALLQSEERVRTFIENVDDMVYFQALNGAVSRLNDANVRISGYSSEEFEQNPRLWQESIHPDDRKISDAFFAVHPQGASSFQQEYRLRTQNDGWRWIHSRKAGARDEMGRYIGYNCIDRDITKRKRAEAALKQTLETLDAKVFERTAELHAKMEELVRTRNELVQSEKMASLGQLTAGFAHELNTPIGVAVGAASSLQETVQAIERLFEQEEVHEEELFPLLEGLAKAADLTLSNLRRAVGLVSSFKRTAVDRTSEAHRLFDVKETVQDVINSLHNKFKRTPVNISVDCRESMTVYGSPGLLEQILTNLMMNSLIHGFDNGKIPGRILIACRIQENQLGLVYNDTGKGMDEAVQKRIFEPFFTTCRASGGSGLGLYVCYNLVVTRLKGRLVCESAPGKGVIFRIDYPVRTSVASALGAPGYKNS
ncbi:MAG: response regulator [Gammaproteobacteria bacterium]|nr:response regulator [Gammaproteobacteria bacterium]